MTYPNRIEGTRICIIRYPDETTICANVAGFRSLAQWIAWLAESDPTELFHFHVLLHLESEAFRYDGVRPNNVWFLRQSPSPATAAILDGWEKREYEMTFQVVSESDLDELAQYQDEGTVPPRFQKRPIEADDHG
jgi:hypothetical protein